METVVMPVRVMRLMGVKLLIITNAAGGLNPEYNVGDIVVIQDHFGMVSLFKYKLSFLSLFKIIFLKFVSSIYSFKYFLLTNFYSNVIVLSNC